VGKRSFNVIEISAIRKLRCGFLFPSIVTMAVSVAVCEIFSVKNGVTLKTRLGVVRGH